MKPQEDQVQVWKTLSLVGQVGLWMVLSILLGSFAGFKLGKMVGHAQGGFIAGILAGILLGWRYTPDKNNCFTVSIH